MEVEVPFGTGIVLQIGSSTKRIGDYPSTRLRKGLILVYNGQELAEEGVGFGVPVIKLGQQTIFPGDLTFTPQRESGVQRIHSAFKMNLEERITRPGKGQIESRSLYRLKNTLAWLMREVPTLRGSLSATSTRLRSMFKWQTTYTEVDSIGDIKVNYTFDMESRSVEMNFDLTGLLGEDITEVIVMNEQGARYFDHYRDSDGSHLKGEEIGIWNEVTADWASFVCVHHGLAFSLNQVSGARFYRGRELVDDRLAWAGFGYSFPRSDMNFQCKLKIERSR